MDTTNLLDRIDLRDLAAEAGARFTGHSQSSRCPLHNGDNPAAFHVYTLDGRQRWHCFTNCPQDANDGDAITFYMRWRGVDFHTAIGDLARRCGLDYASWPGQREAQPAPAAREPAVREPAVRESTPGPNAVWAAAAEAFIVYAHDQLYQHSDVLEKYLVTDRGLTRETIAAWRIGYNPADLRRDAARWGLPKDDQRPVWCARGITIPTYLDGRPVHVNVRRPLPGDSLAAVVGPVSGLKDVKYTAVRGGSRHIFGADYLRGLPVCVICEGEFDALLLWQECGDLVDVITIGGARQKLRADDAVHLLRARRLLVAYDTDAAGAAGSDALAALGERVTRVTPPAHDITDAWREVGSFGLRQWLKAQL